VTLPSGTVTFLFTDIEGSTRLMRELGDRYLQAQQAHHRLLREAFQENKGIELRTEGDSFFCAFEGALDACKAAAGAQTRLAANEWPDGMPIKVRIGLHTGEAPVVGNEYVGLDVHHAARIASAAHGGQVLLSGITNGLVSEDLPSSLSTVDLGLHRLKDLARAERLYQLRIEGLPDAFPALRTLDATPNNLPTQLTSFVGRDGQVRDGKALLAKTRLLTLTGPGGTGKTRLSLQIAADIIDSFPDGVFFVPLSAIRDPELVASAVAQALNVPVAGRVQPIEAVVEHLREKKALLVLDNYEQLLPDGAEAVSELLHACPNLKVVVSSRTVLRVYGEQEFAVPPLQLPDLRALPGLQALSQFEAVKLFIERALAVKPDFQATNENAPAIAGVCERVDGLPLAIELAAARVKLFSPQALLGRLETSLNALGTGSRDLPSRQQTLQGAIAWSYDLLDDAHRRLMWRMSVFARGADLETAEKVCGPAEEVGGDVLTGLDELADQSLLRRMPDYDPPRLQMLQTIREFALEKLEASGEQDLIRGRHAEAFRELASGAASRFFGPDQKEWLDRLDLEHDNLRAALDWYEARGDVEQVMEFCSCLWRFWQMRGHLHEARTRLDRVLAMPASRDHPDSRRRALEAAGGVAYWQADMPAARIFYDENLELARATGDPKTIGDAIYNATFPLLVGRLDMDEARVRLNEALDIFRQLGDKPALARCLWALGNANWFLQQLPDAATTLDEAIALSRETGDRFNYSWALHTRGLVAIDMKQPDVARPLIEEAMRLFAVVGDVSGIVLVLSDFADLAILDGDRERAARLVGAATTHEVRSGAGLASLVAALEQRGAARLMTEADDPFQAEGRGWTLDQAVAYALGDDLHREASAV
jgi:predicted ATPase/class 3 adenylate cyclase